MKKLIYAVLLLYAGTVAAQQIPKFDPSQIDIPYKKYVLSNGLRLIVHEDHKAPIAAVNVWYHVGSKNEKPGKSGFAHLFEHLMFNGSENYNNDYFQALESIGATDLNGTTNSDRTNYFQNIPAAALDQVLFLESDRMGHLLGAIDQAKLDEQRGVVQNEKRQGENEPYGRSDELSTLASYPKGHPYSWTVIGSMEDLNAASLEDVKEWFSTYYGAANAVLVIAGDVNPDEIHEKVKKYFGDIPSGPTLAKYEVNVAKRSGEIRQYFQDRVPEAKISMSWNTPEWGNPEAIYLDLAARVLSSGKSSRLYKKLVYEDQSARSSSAYQYSQELGGQFGIDTYVKTGKSTSEVEASVHKILADFLANGPTQEELDRVKATYFASFIKGLERIGGFGGKSDVLAEYEVYGGSPDAYKKELEIFEKASVKDVHEAAKKWLSDGIYTLICEPFPAYTATESGIDRSKLPALGTPAVSKFPAIESTTLANGMKVMLAKRSGVPTVIMQLMFDAGYSSDQSTKPGLASLAMNLLDEGTQSMDALQISERLQLLGASFSTFSGLDMSGVYMSTLVQSLDPSLDVFSEVLLKPAFAQKDFDRLKNQQLASIKAEKSQPFGMALRVAPKFMYGEKHAYGVPFSGSGYESSVSQISREDVVKFYDAWIRPNNGTLVVVGDIDLNTLKAKLESRFASWQKGKVPVKNLPTVGPANQNTLYLMDRPESEQSIILAGHLAAPYGKISEVPAEAFLNIFGGDFTSRVNMNLREDKHWAYGAGSFLPDAKGQRPMFLYAPVQTDKTKESIQEIIKEAKAIIGDKPVTTEEMEKVRNNNILKLPGQWETNSSVASSISNIATYNLALDYYQTYDQKVRNMSLDEVRAVGKEIVKPEQLVWFVVGDKEKIYAGLKELGFAKIVMVDPDGKIIE